MANLNDIEKSLDFEILSISKVSGGINSAVYKICSDEKIYALKVYPSLYVDKRHRLKTEIEFLLRCSEIGEFSVPRLLNYNIKENWSLLSWIEGDKLENFNQYSIDQYLEFLLNIQKVKDINKKIIDLPDASEAQFSIDDHLFVVTNKLNKLFGLFENINSSKIKRIYDYLIKEVIAIRCFIDSNNYINMQSDKFISPSDVGIHNLLYKKKKIYFFDFEYAGWDDPYKFLADISIQPNFIFNKSLHDYLLEKFFSRFKYDLIINKLKLITALYRIKWIYIIFKRYNYSVNEIELGLEKIHSYLLDSSNYGITIY